MSESKTVLGRIDYVEKKLKLKIDEAIANRGYGKAENLEELQKHNIQTNIPLWSGRSGVQMFRDLDQGFTINETDGVLKITCP